MGESEKQGTTYHFPHQPLPPSTRVLCATHPDTEVSQGTLIDEFDHVKSYKSPHPFLIDVGVMNGVTVVHGGFGVKVPREYTAKEIRSFPPPPNSAYAFASQAHPRGDCSDSQSLQPTKTSADAFRKKFAPGAFGEKHSPSLMVDVDEEANITGIVDCELEVPLDVLQHQRNIGGVTRDSLKAAQRLNPLIIPRKTSPPNFDKAAIRQKSMGELLADTVDFERETWVTRSPGVSGELYPGHEQREDFIQFINQTKPELEFCKKCQTAHIPPGSPITLEDRDTCGSQLPEWFPADEFDQPWKQFRKMINDMVHLTELTQGYNHSRNPEARAWNLQYHDMHKKWKAIGRRGGWWKCRDGVHATDLERECKLCHDSKEKEKTQERKNSMTIVERLKVIHDYIDFHMRRVAENDKKIVLANAQAGGIPEYIGHTSLEEAQFRNPVLSRHASASTVYAMHNRGYSIDTTCSYASSVNASSAKMSAHSESSALDNCSPQHSTAVEHISINSNSITWN